MKKHPSLRLIALCYLAGALIWCAQGVLGLTVRGASYLYLPSETTCLSFVNYADLPYDEPPQQADENWFLSTDSDPQILLSLPEKTTVQYLDLKMVHYYPPGSVTLYYLLPGQTAYSEAQKLYAACTDTGYRFDLGGRQVTGLRIDPDSRGGVPTRFTGILLTPYTAADRFIPRGGWLPVLLFGPMVLAAVLYTLGHGSAGRGKTDGTAPIFGNAEGS